MVKKIYHSDENKNSVDIVWKVPHFGTQSYEKENNKKSDNNSENQESNYSCDKDWQQEVDNYICDGAVGTELTIGDLNLDDEEVLAVKASVAGISEMMLVSVSSEKIVLRKVK